MLSTYLMETFTNSWRAVFCSGRNRFYLWFQSNRRPRPVSRKGPKIANAPCVQTLQCYYRQSQAKKVRQVQAWVTTKRRLCTLLTVQYCSARTDVEGLREWTHTTFNYFESIEDTLPEINRLKLYTFDNKKSLHCNDLSPENEQRPSWSCKENPKLPGMNENEYKKCYICQE